MKKLVTFLSLALSVIVLILLVKPTAIAAPPAAPDYQRYITFHNDFDFPIFPVIQVPADICDGAGVTRVRRIVVNGAGHDGLQPDETLTVLIPQESNNPSSPADPVIRCWYRSGRIYIFPVNLTTFEGNMVEVDSNNSSQTTNYKDPTHPSVAVPCYEGPRNKPGASGNCTTGVADNSFAADVPAQLAEYTFDSDNASTNGDPDSGIAMADIDVSHVDDLYLPIAASVVNNGATGYMGGAMDFPTFRQRISNFFTHVPWPNYSAYLSQNQPSGNIIKNAIDATQLPPDLGGGTNTPAPHLPAGYNSIQNTLSKATSSVYEIKGSTSNYLISGVLNQNSQVQPYLDRWMGWMQPKNGDPCTGANFDQLIWPDGITSTFNKQNFCAQFQTTAQTVWNHFLTDQTDGFQSNQAQFYKDCGLSDAKPDQNQTNACIIQHIIGYNSTVLGGELPGQVQALLRGVAYNAADGIDPNNQQYQYDPFLTFAAPYNSQFNLDPYTRLIHSTKDGVGAVAYSFSIDDKYGNFRDASLGILVDAGGTSALDNQQPYDPYQQYQMNWGYNRDQFSLIAIASGVNLANVQAQLQAIAAQNDNRPFLIKQDQTISVLGHATSTNWTLTTPLVTLAQLQYQAQQEEARGNTKYYQTLIDYLFGNSTANPPVQSIFPTAAWDGNSQNPPAIDLLDFDAASNWSEGQAILYGYIIQQNADVPAKGNWVKASVCGFPKPITINQPGSQRLPVKLNQPCEITLTDTYNETMTFSLTPASKQVTDTYTGTQVSVMSLPIGGTFSGSPLTVSNLTASDLKNCQNNSSNQRIAGFCNNITLSAVWSADAMSRDIVYMGLDPKDMPRVNVNLPAAPPTPIDPTLVSWPPNAAITFQQQNGQIVQVSWPAAVVGPNQTLQYTLYVKDGSAWTPQSCDPSQTSCRLNLGSSASVYVIAINTSAPTKPQTTNLYGCYPAANPCPPTTSGRAPKPRSPRR